MADKKWKSDISMKNRILYYMAPLILISLTITIILTNIVSKNIYINSVLESALREQALIINDLDSKINHIKDYAITVSVNPQVISEMKAHPSAPVDRIEQFKLKHKLNKITGSIIGLNHNVYMWDLITMDNTFLEAGGYNMSGVKRLVDDEYFAAVRQNWGVSISGPYELISQNGQSILVFLAVKPIMDMTHLVSHGYIMFVIKESSFASIFASNMPRDSKSVFYILNNENMVISSNNKKSISRNIQELGDFNESELGQLYDKGFLNKNIGENEILYTMSGKLKYPVGWTAGSCQSMGSLLAGQKALNRWVLLIGAATCLVALFLSYVISSSLSKPLMELTYIFNDAAKGELGRSKLKHKSVKEINVLYEGFNNLMNAINRLIRKVSQEQEKKSEYQFRLIQAQVRPHFLYNTLEMIKSLIDLGMEDTASQCILAMSSFYRFSLSRGNEVISVSDEIKLSQNYMYLQKLRYIEYLDYHFDIPDELTKYQIPKMTLQPILENSIYHGIRKKAEKGMVTVSLKEFGKYLRITISDDGVGMTNEDLSLIRQTIGPFSNLKESKLSKSFGIANINWKLKLLYGKDYSFTINSEYKKFTEVTLIIPKTIPTDLLKAREGGYGFEQINSHH